MAFLKENPAHMEYLDTILSVTEDYKEDSISLNSLIKRLEKVFTKPRTEVTYFEEIKEIFYVYIYRKPSAGKGGDTYYISLDALKKLKAKQDK